MAGIATKAAQWLLDAVMLRRLAVLQVLLFVVRPVAVAAAVAVGRLKAGEPGWLIVSVVLVGVTVGFWVRELQRHRMRRQR